MIVHGFLSKRFNALRSGDFKTVFDSYHQDAPFICQFAGCQDYVEFANQQLSDINIVNWSSPAHRAIDDHQIECILVMELSVDGRPMFFYENALLIEVGGEWFYHSAQKLGADDYTGLPAEIAFSDFERAADKIRY